MLLGHVSPDCRAGERVFVLTGRPVNSLGDKNSLCAAGSTFGKCCRGPGACH